MAATSIRTIFYVLTLCLMSAGVLLFAPPQHTASAEEGADCTVTINEPADIFSLALNDQITFSNFSVSEGNTASINITNNTNCNFPVNLASYKVSGSGPENQSLHASSSLKEIEPGSNQVVSVDLPNCTAQIDLLYDVKNPLETPVWSNPDLISYTFQYRSSPDANKDDIPEENDMFHFSEDSPYSELDNYPNDKDEGFTNMPEGQLCDDDDTQPLTVKCSVEPDSPQTGDTVTWEADVSGGSGNYTYQWTKDVSGTNQAEEEVYTTTSEKTGRITVNDEEKAECNVTVSKNNGGGGSGDIDITSTGSHMWTVSDIALPSTKTTLDISKSGISQPVTLTATSSGITNNETKFIHDGGSPQTTLTLSPGELNDPIKLFTEADVAPATYPVTVTAQTTNGLSASAITSLRAQSYIEF